MRLCTEAVRAKKSLSATNFNRLLAVANPANGPEFFHKVNRHFDVYQSRPKMTLEKLQLICTARVPGKFKARWCRWWNMSKGGRAEYNFPKSPALDTNLWNWIDRAAFWAGLKAECEKKFLEILREDNVVLKTEQLANSIQGICAWLESWSIRLWDKAFTIHLAKKTAFLKSEEFMAQMNCDKTMKRAVLRYFWRELAMKGALEPSQLPIRLLKWIGTSDAECIFTESQRRCFSRHHLLQCPWYLELKDVDPTHGEEVQQRARCDAMSVSGGDDGMLHSSVAPLVVAKLTKKAKEAAAAKAAAKAQEKEALRQEIETARTLKKETRERNKELAALVAKEGPEKLISQLGRISASALPTSVAPAVPISPSASSWPSTFIAKPLQTVYSIPAIEHVQSAVGVKVMCQGSLSIMPLFDSVTEEGDDPALFTEMREFLKDHSGTRARRHEGKDCDLGLADMVFFDISEDLPVLGIDGGVDVPGWNKPPSRLTKKGHVDHEGG